MTDPIIEVNSISFRYGEGQPLALDNARLALQPGARCLLVGANGAGKTTLLRVIGGKHLIGPDEVRVLGRPAFHDTTLASRVVYLSASFPFAVDIRVSELLAGIRADPVRRDRLLQILDVDLQWHMHRVSEGQRRRVQLLMGLLHPFQVLLLDEITTDLDLLARTDLLAFLRQETETHKVAILYATHILDRMETWATELAFVERGRILVHQPLAQIEALQVLQRQGVSSPLSRLVEQWMRGGVPAGVLTGAS